MTIVPISAEPVVAALESVQGTATSGPQGVFDKLYVQFEDLNTQLINTDQSVQRLASGETENLHQVMLSLEQTRLAFDLMLQVRNKVLDAYQEVMRMQV